MSVAFSSMGRKSFTRRSIIAAAEDDREWRSIVLRAVNGLPCGGGNQGWR